MVSFKSGLPLIRDEDGKSVAFDLAWLRTTLATAAFKAGHHGWWLADDLAVGITTFLKRDYPESVIDLTKLETAVQTVLTDVGYAEVARNYRTVMPCHQISLARCLRHSPCDDHPEFFRRLGEEIAELGVIQPQHIHFSDLHDCVRGLTSVYAGTNAVEISVLLHMVVTFVRDQVQSSGWQSLVRCSIS